MVDQWQPGVQYDYGSVVEFECNTYRIIQPHRSQNDWTPPVTPALWGRIPAEHHESAPQQPNNPEKGWNEQPTTHVEPHHEERQKQWYDLDDQRKKQLEVGGGLLAGVALLGGGFALYQHHQKSEEDARTAAFYQNGPQGPVTWVLAHGKQIPKDAIVGGEDSGHTLYICRAFQDGGIQLGKASNWFQKGAVIGYSNEEIQLDTYEILIGDPNAVRWVDVMGDFDPNALGARPVEGGKENNGSPLYIAQAPIHGSVTPGKIRQDFGGAFVPYGGKEHKVKEYRVLCYA
ncbi:hypothetical protein HWV62_40673 [Athelia sp. TMB]|nr:hypothetical protein HWV62_40673 [Athelia sp. TMB]